MDVEETRLELQNRSLRAQVKELSLALAAANRRQEISESINSKTPKWLKPRSGRKRDLRATPTLLLSDLHLDEVVEPSAIHGCNMYNRDIAHKRFDRVINKAMDIPKRLLSPDYRFDGMVLMLAGDMVSGSIHQELSETNETTAADTVVHWTPYIASAIEALASVYGRVHIPCVAGNHDRLSVKPRHKMMAKDTMCWLMYHWLADRFSNNEAVSFSISSSADLLVPIYDTTYMLTHGNQFRGGSGIAGPTLPWMRGEAKKNQRQVEISRWGDADVTYDWLVMGHFHISSLLPRIIVNGSLKGYDEFAFDNNFAFAPPSQTLWLTTPEYGVTFHQPIVAIDRKVEGW